MAEVNRAKAKARSTPPSPHSVIKILISTDNHLGYLEKDPVRGNDSFRVFEEVLQLAKSNQVDMLLLAGDLFHDNKPSRATVIKTMRLLRNACLAPGGTIRLAVRSDPAAVNYMDPTMAVSLPVFVIHGNHDDPTGASGLGALSALDLLSEAGLVTYFGKMPNSKRIQMAPILLQKGRTALALYGLGNIRDEVLYQTWAKERNVKWLSPMPNPADRDRQRHLPDTDAGGDDDLRWFNLLVLHQNRVTRGISRGISETLLPPWLDYVVWGHEHDSIPDLTLTSPPVVQPGSTVATSLSAGESKQKHAILLEVYRGKLKHRPVPLYTVRNFRFDDVSLSAQSNLSETEPASVSSFLEDSVKTMAAELETEFDNKLAAFQNGTFKQNDNGIRYPPLQFYIDQLTPSVRQPLIRLRVEISGSWDVPNPQRFGQTFLARVASATEILLFYRSKRRLLKKTTTFMQGYSGQGALNKDGENGELDEDENGLLLSQNGAEQRDVVQIPKLVQYYLYHSKAGGTGLKFLELDKLTGAVDHFVNKMEPKAIADYVSSYLKVQQDISLEEAQRNEGGLDEDKLLEKFKAGAAEAAKRVLVDPTEKLKNSKQPQKTIDDVEMAGDTPKRAKPVDEGEASNQHNDSDKEQRDEGASKNDDREGAVEKQLDQVHALLSSNAKLAAALQNHKPLEESDDNVSDGKATEEVTPSRARTTTARGRGRARARARGTRSRGIDSYIKKKETPVETSTRRPAAASKSRRTRRKTESMVVEDSDEEDGNGEPSSRNQVVAVDDVEEEYAPVASSSHKRRARTGAGGATRASQRSRTESAAAPEPTTRSAPRRSALAGRARTRRNTATINVDEESGDDAM